MAKAKTKRTGYDREVTVGDKGRMSWVVCGLEFIYFGTKSGLNLAVVRDGQEAMLCFCKNLDEAGIFAEGFGSGWTNRGHFDAPAK